MDRKKFLLFLFCVIVILIIFVLKNGNDKVKIDKKINQDYQEKLLNENYDEEIYIVDSNYNPRFPDVKEENVNSDV